MNGVYVALVLVSLLAAASLVAFVWEEVNRRERKPIFERLQMQLAAGEEQLDSILGPRHSVDVDDPTRRAA